MKYIGKLILDGIFITVLAGIILTVVVVVFGDKVIEFVRRVLGA